MVGVLGVLDQLSGQPPVGEGGLVGVGAPADGGAGELGAKEGRFEAVQGPALRMTTVKSTFCALFSTIYTLCS